MLSLFALLILTAYCLLAALLERNKTDCGLNVYWQIVKECETEDQHSAE